MIFLGPLLEAMAIAFVATLASKAADDLYENNRKEKR
jgi:hypothetical protein